MKASARRSQNSCGPVHKEEGERGQRKLLTKLIELLDEIEPFRHDTPSATLQHGRQDHHIQ